ncbi:hypothetical protein TNCV_4000801 [Trichonephila clavipes]|nr:hypothetical protein TNCV_4000801 [Trichonephila clavipes]
MVSVDECGYCQELVISVVSLELWVRILVPLNSHRIQGLMHVKSVEVQSPHVSVERMQSSTDTAERLVMWNKNSYQMSYETGTKDPFPLWMFPGMGGKVRQLEGGQFELSERWAIIQLFHGYDASHVMSSLSSFPPTRYPVTMATTRGRGGRLLPFGYSP